MGELTNDYRDTKLKSWHMVSMYTIAPYIVTQIEREIFASWIGFMFFLCKYKFGVACKCLELVGVASPVS